MCQRNLSEVAIACVATVAKSNDATADKGRRTRGSDRIPLEAGTKSDLSKVLKPDLFLCVVLCCVVLCCVVLCCVVLCCVVLCCVVLCCVVLLCCFLCVVLCCVVLCCVRCDVGC